MEKIISDNIPEALILEDDIFLNKRFPEVLRKTRKELQQQVADGEPVWVGFEASCLKLVSRSEREPGRVVYPSQMVQCMGAYYINRSMAQAMVATVREQKMDIPCDWFADRFRSEVMPSTFYWTHPITATQGSHNGKMKSGIDAKSTGLFRQITCVITMTYKRLVSNLR